MEALGEFLVRLGPMFGVLLMTLGIGVGIVMVALSLPRLLRRRHEA